MCDYCDSLITNGFEIRIFVCSKIPVCEEIIYPDGIKDIGYYCDCDCMIKNNEDGKDE